jgi:MarR family transcriptional regulator, organic hydroperoxide resistance regulator
VLRSELLRGRRLDRFLVVGVRKAAKRLLPSAHRTPHGLSAREPVREARAALQQHVTATLTAAERNHLHSALVKIIAQLQDESP